MKHFVKSWSKDADCFKYFCRKCLNLLEVRLKKLIFVGSDIRKLTPTLKQRWLQWRIMLGYNLKKIFGQYESP